MRKLHLLGMASVCAALFGWSTLSSSREKEPAKEMQLPYAADESVDCDVVASREELAPSAERVDDALVYEVWSDPKAITRDFIVPEELDPVCVTRTTDSDGQEKIEATYKIHNEEGASGNAHVTVTVDPDGEEHISAGIGFSRTW